MSCIKNIYSESKNPALSISILYFNVAAVLNLAINYLIKLTIEDSLSDYITYSAAGLVYVLITSVILFFLVKSNIGKIRYVNHERDNVIKKLKLQFDSMPVGFLTLDADFFITDWNPAAEKIFGYTKKEALGKNPYELILPGDITPFLEEIIEKIKNSNGTIPIVNDNVTKDGRRITCQWYSTPLLDENNNYVGMMAMASDITDKLKSKEQNNKLLSAVEQNPASIIINSIDGVMEYVNPMTTQITGYTKEELIGKRPEMVFISEHVPEAVNKDILDTLFEGKKWNGELLNKKKSGELYWAKVTIVPVFNANGNITHFVGIEEDITEKKLKDQQIKHSLEEKELMIKEIHHRVKNNLQIISSLLSLQSRNIKDPEMQKLFNMSRDRVQSMALIHQQLYKTDDMTKINFDEYMKTLAKQLLVSYEGANKRIKINSSLNHISFGLDTAIPCGLIINELLSNSIKHGFNGSRSGEIDIEIKNIKDGKYMLSVADNGVGLPAEFKTQNGKGMGMQLVKALTNQLDGKINICNGKGTRFEIEFEEANYERISMN